MQTAGFSTALNMFRDFHVDAYGRGEVPLSSTTMMLSIVVAYLLGTFGLQKFMEKRQALSFKWLVFVHNGLLSFASLVLLVLYIQHLLPKLLSHGLYFVSCDASIIGDGRLALLSYVNYMLKYYELIDTFFLLLKKKELQFLHVYHHALTLILCHVQLAGATSIQWIPITINLFVHVLMYYYYAAVTVGKDVWWKKYLTMVQIIQFVIDIVFCWGAIYLREDYVRWKRIGLDCHGDWHSAYFGALLLSSYLLLFVDFFFKRYDTPASKKGSNTNAKHATNKANANNSSPSAKHANNNKANSNNSSPKGSAPNSTKKGSTPTTKNHHAKKSE